MGGFERRSAGIGGKERLHAPLFRHRRRAVPAPGGLLHPPAGRSPLFFEEEQLRFGREEAWKDSPLGMRYYQAHAPLTEQNEAVGHAVRAMYLYSGMADVAGATGDGELAAACGRLWESAVRRRMYVTGALGSSEHGEAFTFDYDLPNDTVYGEMRVWIRE